jgi:hypothetical protein
MLKPADNPSQVNQFVECKDRGTHEGLKTCLVYNRIIHERYRIPLKIEWIIEIELKSAILQHTPNWWQVAKV